MLVFLFPRRQMSSNQDAKRAFSESKGGRKNRENDTRGVGSRSRSVGVKQTFELIQLDILGAAEVAPDIHGVIVPVIE